MYARPFLLLAAPAFTRNGLAGQTRLLGAVVLKYLRVKYSRMYRVSPYTIIVYGSCRGAKLAGLVV